MITITEKVELLDEAQTLLQIAANGLLKANKHWQTPGEQVQAMREENRAEKSLKHDKILLEQVKP
jgi:hypothetical protein